MSTRRCNYCGKYYQSKLDDDKCIDCNIQFKRIFDKVYQKYERALKRLKDK